MEYKKYKSKYNVGYVLSDGRKILDINRIAETDYRFLLYCDKCKTEKWVRRQDGLRRPCTGCGGKIWKHDTEESRKENKLFTNYRYRAKKRGHEFSLTRTEFLQILSYNCYWCGFDGIVGVDRLDNNQGYTLKNSVACCKKCNYAKNDMSLDEWYDWLYRIATYRNN